MVSSRAGGLRRPGDPPWLRAATSDAHLHGLPGVAREFAHDLVKAAAGPEDVNALYTLGEALVLDCERAGWELLAWSTTPARPASTCGNGRNPLHWPRSPGLTTQDGLRAEADSSRRHTRTGMTAGG